MYPGNLQIKMTEDGSQTLYVPSLGESYHSLFGAVNESLHVFIEAGFKPVEKEKKEIGILEIGLGTGLNILLTYIEACRSNAVIDYIAIDPYPLPMNLVMELNYPEILSYKGIRKVFHQLHSSDWNNRTVLSKDFHLTKFKSGIGEFSYTNTKFDLIYFDAFSPDVQSELWTLEIFMKLALLAKTSCVLVTYSAKGEVRRNLQKAGFSTERLPGPKGKREILRATKL
jgi:tRNA U34 5-methylaminomethyl-2-thiouridine-forming methyltransferase MnmC